MDIEEKRKYYNPLTENTTWMDHGNCIGIKQEIFFEDQETKEYLDYCIPCDIRLKCLLHGIKWDSVGIWGGLTYEVRNTIVSAPSELREGLIHLLLKGGD